MAEASSSPLRSAVAAACVAPSLFTSAVAAAGFGASGIVAGSPAAAFMASYGGLVSSGSICATLQSIGAVGLGPVGFVVTGAVGAAVSIGVSAYSARKNSPVLVVVQSKDGLSLAVEVLPLDTIGDVKSKIEVKSGIPKDKQTLHFSDISLEDHRKVQDYGIKDQSVIVLVCHPSLT
ncbi:hypothetical protein BGX21_001910 [Mortierella sp. AD011]|nr:hypothetical protein BGX20_001588 [Mortierella sp. AD010]KAF9403614.1 hypothetical protein BGX21_001910 [Mortierella sp. AD011]